MVVMFHVRSPRAQDCCYACYSSRLFTVVEPHFVSPTVKPEIHVEDIMYGPEGGKAQSFVSSHMIRHQVVPFL